MLAGGALNVGKAAGETVITLLTGARARPHASVAVHVSVTTPPQALGAAVCVDRFDVPFIKQLPLKPLV